MVATYLDDIVAHHRARASRDGRDWRARLEDAPVSRGGFTSALRDHESVAVIAEVKRRSPSKGWIRRDLDALAQARAYKEGGAVAVSVLSDEEYFGGCADDVESVAREVGVPVLRKDFTVSPNDVIDAAQMGASAVLLIVAVLSDLELHLGLDVASRVGLDALVEVHDEVEAHRALDAGAGLIGVNQRDLVTFDVDADRAARVAGALPDDVVRVAESGLSSRADVVRAADCGFDAVLVGESLVRAKDPAEAVRALAGVAKGRRG